MDELGVLRVVKGRVAKQRVDGCQARIPGAHTVGPLVLQVIEEAGDQAGIEVSDVELGRRFVRLLGREADQQPQGVAVGRHRFRAGVPLTGQPVGEEGLQGGRERTHDGSSRLRSKRFPARASNSGAADRYQYVLAGWTWPR